MRPQSVQGGLEAFADAEARGPGSWTLNRGAGARIASGAGLAFDGNETAEANQAYLGSTLQRRRNGAHESFQRIARLGLGKIGAVSNRVDQFGLRHIPLP